MEIDAEKKRLAIGTGIVSIVPILGPLASGLTHVIHRSVHKYDIVDTVNDCNVKNAFYSFC